MKHLLFIKALLFTLLIQGQTNAEALYSFKEYTINITDSIVIISNPNFDKVKVLFKDYSNDYYIDEYGKEVSSTALELLKQSDPEAYGKIKDADDHYLSFSNSKLLSVVGGYISYSNEYYAEGGAHPSYGTNYVTYNLETKKEIHLTDIFDEDKIVEALIRNSFIKKYLQSDNIKDLDLLYEEFMIGAGCDYRLDLSDFSFGEINDDKVNINIGVSYDCEVSRGNFEVISIELTMPKKLIKDLINAKKLNLLDSGVVK